MAAKKYFVFLIFFKIVFFSSQNFDVIPLGIYGGDREDNLSAYLVSKHGSSSFLSLDAGTINAGIREAIARETIQDSAVHFLKNNIKGYFISHAHLDHISGLIINSPADSQKEIYCLPKVKDIILKHYLMPETWVNFSDEGEKPLGKYHFQTPIQGEIFEIKNTELSATMFQLSHVEPYKSSALLVKNGEDALLYFGDTGADRIEKSNAINQIWTAIAPTIKNHQLKAIFIEVSFPNSQPEHLLFGHLTPKLLFEELKILSKKVGEQNMKGLNIVITHIKPSGQNEEKIKKELKELNDLGVHLIFPVQGKKIQF